MKASTTKVAIIVLTIFVTSSLNAEVVTEATVGSGYRGNLFNDSNSTDAAYGSAGVDLKYYPSASAQLVAGAHYEAYSEQSDLSNLTGDLTFTLFPTPATSPFSLGLAGSVAVRKFGPWYQVYDQVATVAGVSLGYRLLPQLHLHSSISYLGSKYVNSDFGSNRGFDFVAGVNLTVGGSNAFALTAEYSGRAFDQPQLVQQGPGRDPAVEPTESETFEVSGLLLRYSRPLGRRTGFNLSVGQRQLHVDSDYTVLGYSVDYLSPWEDLWEGASLSAGLKHFFPGQVTTEFSFGYVDKTFVDVIELSEVASETYWQDTRDDRLTTLALSLSRPVTLQNGKQLTPALHVGYRKNQSSIGFFDYDDVSASVSLKVAF